MHQGLKGRSSGSEPFSCTSLIFYHASCSYICYLFFQLVTHPESDEPEQDTDEMRLPLTSDEAEVLPETKELESDILSVPTAIVGHF